MSAPPGGTPPSAKLRSWSAPVVTAVIAVLSALAVAELGLRIARFHFDLVPALEFGWPDPVALNDVYRPDPDLVWTTRDYPDVLREAHRHHPAVVFMGDSVTEFGTYSAQAIELLKTAGSPLTTGVKVGVGGWTTEQGLRQLRRDVIPLHPQIVTVFYGWNDHWIARGLTDPEITAARRLLGIARVSRLAQLWLKLKVNMAARRRPAPNRVPLPRYEANLRTIAREAHAAGISPVFITAPSNHVAGHEPAYLARRHVRSLSELVPLHTMYTDATRRVAREMDVPLCDAAASFAALPQPHDVYFQKDGIHLTSAGDRELARIISTCLLPLAGQRSRRREMEPAPHVVAQRSGLPLDAEIAYRQLRFGRR